MAESRIQWLDIAKGITIILMVMGHSSLPKVAEDFIFAFHMPLFFIASGLTTKYNVSFSSFIINKLRKLILPFAIYSAIVLCLEIYLMPDGTQSFSHWLLNGWQCYALWFIPVLFLASIIAYIVVFYTNHKLTILCAFILAIGGAVLSYCNIYLPWTISTVPYASALIILGYLMKPYIQYVSKYSWIILFVGFVLTTVVSHYFRMDMAGHVCPVKIRTDYIKFNN